MILSFYDSLLKRHSRSIVEEGIMHWIENKKANNYSFICNSYAKM